MVSDPVLLSVQQRLRIRGAVQGVGFRPFVYRLASELSLDGWVRNDGEGVEAVVRGAPFAVARFRDRLSGEAPRLARIDAIETREDDTPLAPAGFAIDASRHGTVSTGVTPDAAICDDCLAELLDPADRRYRYPFINCTHCGPRFTITGRLPYDRPNTSMAGFRMCSACLREYDAPADRRFHAQPNACPICGPRLWLTDAAGGRLEVGDVIAATACRIAAGDIVAIKGLGGFHLVCDARNADAVARLRSRKHRDEKPFALMFANIESIAPHAHVDAASRAALHAVERPIVLLAKREGCDARLPGIAPGLAEIGAMLPYTPLHVLLFHEAAGRPQEPAWLRAPQPPVLVMTSANPGGEPLVIGNDEAVARLGAIADAFVMHDRDILVRCDDSVVRSGVERSRSLVERPASGVVRSRSLVERPASGVVRPASGMGCGPAAPALASDARRPTRDQPLSTDARCSTLDLVFVRRARGYTPAPIRLPRSGPPVLATGAFLKNAACLTRGAEAFLSQHIGDLDNAASCMALEEAVEHLQQVLEVRPRAVAHDLHPDVFGTRLALRLAAELDVPAIGVQHHHAHIAAVAAEHGVAGPLLGLALDGVGHGDDGEPWGGELLRVDGPRCERLGHLRALPLPGGDRAAREPWRMAAAALHRLGRDADIERRFGHQPAAAAVAQMLARGVRCPATTSAGRWFDAAAGLLGVREVMAYEGQAAMLLEGLAATRPEVAADPGLYVLGAGVLDLLPLAERLADETDAAFGAALFHHTFAVALAEWTVAAARETGLDTVALGGGCFLNGILSNRLAAHLREVGLRVLCARQAPPNDGGIALGQAWVAVNRMN